MKRIVLVFLSLVLASQSLYAMQVDAENISPGQYFQTTLAEIVAQQIDDHQVFGSVFRMPAQFQRQPLIFFRIVVSGSSPFDRLGLNFALRNMQKPFR